MGGLNKAKGTLAAALAGAVVLGALLPAVASADFYGTKGLNKDEGGNPPTVLYHFHESGARAQFVGEVRLAGAGVALDAAALSPVHGLVAFQIEAAGSRLVRLDPGTAVATVIGPFLEDTVMRGAVFVGPDRLVAIDTNGGRLVDVDPITGLERRAVPLSDPIGAGGDLAVDAAGAGIMSYYDVAAKGTRFVELDVVTGQTRPLFLDDGIRPGDRYPVAAGGLAMTDLGGGNALFAFDSHDMDDVFRYDIPFHPGGRFSLYLDVHPSFNAGNVDLAGYVEPIPSPSPSLTESPTLSATPTARPTLTPTPSATPTASPTPTATLSPTPSATPTITPTPAPLYLPIALRERCIPDQRRVDVVLVIDASSSMQDPTSTGRPKIAAALDAARIFLDNLQPARGDQAAIVAFNTDATLIQPLTTDRAALASALARIQIAPQTCLVCGVEAADAELAGPRHRPDHAATMIVLTDGRSNPRPAGEAVERAAVAKARGVTVFTIGLGNDLDAEALTAMASRPAFAYRAPDAEDLADIYRAIAVAIPCPAGGFWGGR